MVNMDTLIPRWIFMQLQRSIWREYLEILLWNLPYAFVKINIKLCCASLLHMHLTIRISNTYWKSYVPCIFRWILALESWYIWKNIGIWQLVTVLSCKNNNIINNVRLTTRIYIQYIQRTLCVLHVVGGYWILVLEGWYIPVWSLIWWGRLTSGSFLTVTPCKSNILMWTSSEYSVIVTG